MPSTAQALTIDNYKAGFLIDDEVIGGVTEMAGGIFAAYVSHYLTGETLEYKEFTEVQSALGFLNAQARNWIFEAVGCGTKKQQSAAPKSCGSGGCSSCH
jgi:hypothetical protein